MNDGKWMNVTDVHACCELQYEKENKAQRNDKCEKCKCVVALRYMWQKKCEKKCDEEQKWQMWIVQVWYGTKTKRNVKKKCDGKQKWQVWKVQVYYGTKICVKNEMWKRNVLRNRNDKCGKCKCVVALTYMWQKNWKTEKWKAWKNEQELKWVLQKCANRTICEWKESDQQCEM